MTTEQTKKKRPPAITKWLRAAGLEKDATALACWESMADEGLGKLQQRAMRLVGEVIRLRKGQEGLRRLRAEEAEFYQRELAAAKRENLGRIQSNLLQTLQSMMAALEGNSRAMHVLAEPVGELLVRLGKEMDKDRDRDRAMEKAQRLGLQFGMSADRVAGSGIPSHWPQPGEGKK